MKKETKEYLVAILTIIGVVITSIYIFRDLIWWYDMDNIFFINIGKCDVEHLFNKLKVKVKWKGKKKVK